MKRGAWPPLLWALILAILAAINAVWTNVNVIQLGTFLAAIGFIVALAVLVAASSPGALRPRIDACDGAPAAVPAASLAAMLAGLSAGSFVFGFAFGTFPIIFGAGLFVASVGRLAVELGAQRRALRRVGIDRPRPQDRGGER